MPTHYLDGDAELVAEGIRLGGSDEVLACATSAAAGEPLSVSHLEANAYGNAARRTGREGDRFERIGMLKISANQSGGYRIAAEWFGLLPGSYTTRDAALMAYGYVLGGEAHGHLEDLKEQWGDSITADDLRSLAG